MCNLYSQTKSQDAMRHVFDAVAEVGEDLIDTAGNLPPMAGIYPDYAAPIIRAPPNGGWQLTPALGHADAASIFGRQAHRSGRDEYPQRRLVALEALAWGGTSLPRAIHQFCRTRQPSERAPQPPGVVYVDAI